MLAVLYLQIPQLVVAIIACALISAVQAARRSVREMSA
jgi:flagellar biosynthesis protein FliQ